MKYLVMADNESGTTTFSMEGTEHELRDFVAFLEYKGYRNVRPIEVVFGEWISTETCLPEFGKRVIVARPYEKGEPLRVEQGYLDVSGWWRVYGTNCKRVRYWMPMPEPPEEEVK